MADSNGACCLNPLTAISGLYRIIEKKELEFYKASSSAWYAISLEHDKALLTLSSAALGLLISLSVKFGVGSSLILIIYCLSMLSFFLTIVFVLTKMKNKSASFFKFLQSEINLNNTKEIVYEKSDFSFYVGILLFMLMGIIISIDSFEDKMHLHLDHHIPVLITPQNDKPTVISETAYLMASPKNLQRLNQAIAEIEAGNFQQHDLIFDS